MRQRVDDTRPPHEGGQGAPGTAHVGGARLARTARPRRHPGVPEPEGCGQAALRHDPDGHPPPDGPRRLMKDWAALLARPVPQPIRIDTNVASTENLNAGLWSRCRNRIAATGTRARSG